MFILAKNSTKYMNDTTRCPPWEEVSRHDTIDEAREALYAAPPLEFYSYRVFNKDWSIANIWGSSKCLK